MSFHREILPILQASCLPCHNQTRAKAGLNLETPAAMLEGGDSGPALVAGNPTGSAVLQAAAHQSEDLVMPPPDNKANAHNLTPEQLGLVSLWIEQGAEMDAGIPIAPEWQAIPSNVVSSFAVALTSDGETVAVSRANRVTLYDLPTGRVSGQLADPALDGVAQRDWVNSLAFSPDSETLAVAGYREVRLWRRAPVSVMPAWLTPPKMDWVKAAFSPDQRHLAAVTSSGLLEILQTADGRKVVAAENRETPVVQIAWSSDSHRLAAVESGGELWVLALDSSEPSEAQRVTGEVTALTWYDRDRRLAIATAGSAAVRTWQVGSTEDGRFLIEPAGELTASGSPVVALAAEPGNGGSLLAASADGSVRRWAVSSPTPTAEERMEGSILRLLVAGPKAPVVVALESGDAPTLVLNGDAHAGRDFGGDPRLVQRRMAQERELALSRLEFDRAGKRATEGEGVQKAADEALSKAREQHQGDVASHAEKERELVLQREAETAAKKEREELTSELQKIQAAGEAADAALEEARTTAQVAAAAELTSHAAVDAAARLRIELERLLAGISETDTAPTMVKARETVAVASSDEEARKAAHAAAHAAAEKARDDLAASAFGAGMAKAIKDRAEIELPPRIKQAEERLEAAQKAVTGLNDQLAKARIKLDGSTQDVALAERSVALALETLNAARAAEQTASNRIMQAECNLGEIARNQARAASPVVGLAATTDGASVWTVRSDGLLVGRDGESGHAITALDLPEGAPLAVAVSGEEEVLVVLNHAIVRVEAGRSWNLQLAIGGPEQRPGEPSFRDRVNAVAFSPDGALLATGGGEPSRSGEVKLWRVSDGSLARDLGPVHSDCVMSVAFSPRGEWLATGGADRFGRITPVSGEGPSIPLEGHSQHVLVVAWSPDGGTLATAGAEGVVKLWNPLTGERRRNVDGFGKEVTGLQAVGFTDQFVAVSGSGLGRVFRADGEKVRELAAAPAFLQALAATPDGGLIAGTGDDGVLRIWDPADGKQRLALAPP